MTNRIIRMLNPSDMAALREAGCSGCGAPWQHPCKACPQAGGQTREHKKYFKTSIVEQTAGRLSRLSNLCS